MKNINLDNCIIVSRLFCKSEQIAFMEQLFARAGFKYALIKRSGNKKDRFKNVYFWIREIEPGERDDSFFYPRQIQGEIIK